jgi:hypothetical protein
MKLLFEFTILILSDIYQISLSHIKSHFHIDFGVLFDFEPNIKKFLLFPVCSNQLIDFQKIEIYISLKDLTKPKNLTYYANLLKTF